MIGVYAIDSMRVRIPLRECTYVSPKLNELIHKVKDETGEIIETETKNWERIEDAGIKTKFSIGTEKIENNYVQCLVMLVNAKMLKKEYLKGIFKDTLPMIYDYLISQNLATFSMDSFLNAYCTDIDIKRDFIEDERVMQDAIKLMVSNTIPHKEMNRGVKKLNNGVEFNTRQNATNSTPYFKIYGKANELKTKSLEFALNHLNDIPNDLQRAEYTIKDSKHLKSLIKSIPNNKLLTLMECTQCDFENAYQIILRNILGHRMRETQFIEKNDKMTPTDIVLINALIGLMDAGMTLDRAKVFLMGTMDRVNKSKWNDKLNSYFNAYIKPIENYSNYDKLEDALVKIGYNF
jgi:hypothetical protein